MMPESRPLSENDIQKTTCDHPARSYGRIIPFCSKCVKFAERKKYMETSKPALFLQGNTSLELARLPNLITVAADVLAGYWIANGVQVDSQLLWLLLATLAVYVAGCALNDYCDREVDPQECPGRPMPGGRWEPWETLILSLALFTIGLGASAFAGGSAPHIMILMIFTTVLYNVGTKKRPYLGPLNLAAYRSLNLIFGMGLPFWLGLSGLPNRYFPILTFLYVFLLNWLSRFEAVGKSKEITAVAFLGWANFIAILLSLSFCPAVSLENLPFLALFMALTGPALLNAGRLQTTFSAGGALKMMVLGIPLLDAVYCSAVRGFAAGVPVALCTVLASLLAISKKVTCDLNRKSGWEKELF
jgi:4-hydroxybenzoate polyprenyltransferase